MILEFLKILYPIYTHFETAKSFVYREIRRYCEADPMSSDDQFRDLQGEGNPKNKKSCLHCGVLLRVVVRTENNFSKDTKRDEESWIPHFFLNDYRIVKDLFSG